MAVGSVLDFDIDLNALTLADRKIDNMVQNSAKLNTNLSNALGQFSSGQINSILTRLHKSFSDLGQMKISPNFDTEKADKLYGIVDSITRTMQLLSTQQGVKLFNTDNVYASNNNIMQIENSLSAVKDAIKKVQDEWNEFHKDAINKWKTANPFQPPINPKTNKAYGTTTKAYKQALAAYENIAEQEADLFAKREKDKLELELHGLNERKKILSEGLKWAKMTEDEKASYIQKTLENLTKAEEKEVKKIQNEYEGVLKEMTRLMKDSDKLSKKNKDGSYDAQIQGQEARFQELNRRREEIERQYGQFVVDNAKKYNGELLNIEANRIREKQRLERETVTGANKFSRNAKSIDEEKQAIEYLIAARNSLSKDTARYDQIVNALNNRIQKHRISVEQLTTAEKNEKTLQPTIRNEYARLLKEIDKVTDAKKRLESTQVYKRGDASALQSYQKLLAYEQDLQNKKVQINTNAQGLLDEVERKHAAERAQIELKTFEDTERRKFEESQKRLKAYQAEYQKTMNISASQVGHVLSSSKKTTNIAQEEEAIRKLENARKKLDKNDKNYQTTLDRLNREIERHEHNIKMATDATYREAEAKKKATTANTTYQGALDYSKNTKNILEQKQAIEYLKQARDKLDKSTLGTAEYEKRVRTINEEIARQQREIDRLQGKMQNFGKHGNKWLNTVDQLTRKLTLLFSVSAIQGYMNKLIGVRKEFELQQRSLQVLLQSKYEADKLWSQTVDLAVRSPFRVKELVTYTRQLAAYRIETDKLHDTTKRLADVSAGLGVDMNRLILAFGQVRAANFLRGTELRQFTEAGIPMLDELAKHFTELEGKAISAGDVFEMISKRMVSFTDVEAVFKRMTDAGGTFYQMQEKQSETLAGSIANLHDSIDLMLNDIGKNYDGVLKGSVQFAKFFVEHWEAVWNAIQIVIVALASYKLNQLLVNSTLIDTARTYGIVTAAEVKHLSLMELLRVKTLGLQKAFKNAGAAWSAFVSVNLPLLAALALVKAVWDIVAAHREHKEVLGEISKEYEELRNNIEKISVDFTIAVDEKDVDAQKKKLEDLVTLAKNDYNITFDVDFSKLEGDEIKNKFNEIFESVYEANVFSEHFAKKMQEAIEWVVEDDVFEDLQELGEVSNDVLNKFASQREKIVFRLTEAQGKLTASQEEARKQLLKGRQANETEVQYLERLRKGYTLLTSEYEELNKKFLKADAFGRSQMYEQLLKMKEDLMQLGIDASDISSTFFSYQEAIDEAEREFKDFLDTINLDKNLPESKKRIMLQAAIDKQASDKNWNDFVQTHIREWIKDKFNVEISPVAPKSKDLYAWQKSYNNLFKGLAGFKEITQDTTKQIDVIERLNENIKTTEELIKRINAAGGLKATLKGGAYEDVDLEKLNRNLEEMYKQQKWFGEITKQHAKDVKQSISQQISLIKEMHNQYKELNKEFDKTTSKQKVMNSYADAFKEIFDDSGLSMTTRIVDDKAIDSLMQTGKVSEEVLEKVKTLKEAGIYIRSFNEELVNGIKEREKYVEEAYNLGDGVWTYGYGETQGVKKGDKISKEEADMKLRKRLTEDFAVSLNKVLDANKDIIVTQEQYNALLDLTYQGGEGAAKRLFNYAKNEESALLHIQDIYEKVKGVFGPVEAERFGEAFVNKFKEAENIYDRIAMLLQTMNLTVRGGEVDERLYGGMLDRSDKRAEAFATGKEVSKIIQQASIEIAQVNIENAKGVVDTLKKLIPYAKTIGDAALKPLLKTIAEFETEIELEPTIKQRENISSQIEQLFGDYEVSIDLEKMNIPKELASQLFDLDALDLDGVREKVLSIFNFDTNLTNQQVLNSKQYEELGRERKEILKETLKKIDDMETKEQKERLNKYIKYLVKASSERVQIKIDELRQISEVDKLDEFEPEQRETIKRSIRLETQEKLDKQAWEDFKNSGMYTQMFEDLEHLGIQSIRNLREYLEKLKNSLTDLPASDLKEVMTQINKLEDLEIKHNPFKEYRDALKEVRDLKKQGDTKKELEQELVASQQRKETAQAELDAIRQVQQAELDGFENENVRNELSQKYLYIISATKEELEKRAKALQSEVDAETKNTDTVNKKLAKYNKFSKVVDGISNGVKEWGEAIISCLDGIDSLLDAFGVAEDSTGRMWVNNAKQIANMIIQTVVLSAAMVKLGIVTKTAMGVIGWIAMALEGVALIFASIFQAGDKRKEQAIQREIGLIEKLERQYKKLEQSIDNAYSIHNLEKDAASAKRNIQSQIRSYYAMIEAEEGKKKTDDDRIKEWRGTIEDLQDQLSELNKDVISSATGGIMDSVMDASREFTNAWLEAFNETGDGLSGLESNFKEAMLEMVKQQAAMLISQSYIEKWKEQLKNYINPYDLELSTDEAKKWVNAVTTSLPQLNQALENYFTAMQQAGIDLGGGTSGELSGLQRGIQGVTEETAQIIEAYLNSIRFFVAEQNTYLSQIAASFDNTEVENPMVEQLRIIAAQTSAINSLLQGLVRGGHSLGGTGLKVFIS